MSEYVQTRIEKRQTEQIDALIPRVQSAYPEVKIRKADVLRMVVSRGIVELTEDIRNERIP